MVTMTTSKSCILMTSPGTISLMRLHEGRRITFIPLKLWSDKEVKGQHWSRLSCPENTQNLHSVGSDEALAASYSLVFNDTETQIPYKLLSDQLGIELMTSGYTDYNSNQPTYWVQVIVDQNCTRSWSVQIIASNWFSPIIQQNTRQKT